jgi:hypothetical protein
MSNTSKDILLTELKRKRSEMAGDLERLEIKRDKFIADIGAIDATIAIYDPSFVGEALPVKQLPPVHPATRGSVSQLLFSILREASAPISTYDLNIHVMRRRNLNTADPKLVKMMHERVLSTLKNHRDRKVLKSIKPADSKFALWELVR